MRILYAAIDQRVPGPHGGAVHVQAVADGLAARGHEVHILATPGPGGFPDGAPHWHALAPPFGVRQLRLVRSRRLLAMARRLQPDVVIERYYNFGGEGVRAAERVGAVAVLEINAPAIDHPGSLKPILDRALIVEPMRRWRNWQCRHADLVVTPTAAILPLFVPRERIVEIEWGADTERFHPNAAGSIPFRRRPGRLVAIFAGAFRPWHGARHLVDAIGRLRAQGQPAIDAVLIGDGPELSGARAAADNLDGVTFIGAIPHEQMPACLAAADIGVAPFDVGAHASLAIDFYWSPLKIFEYMAAGLPVVAPSIDRLRRIVRDGREGLLYDAGDPGALARTLERLLDPALRTELGRAGRLRATAEFSWAAHCERLDTAIAAALARRRSGGQHVAPTAGR